MERGNTRNSFLMLLQYNFDVNRHVSSHPYNNSSTLVCQNLWWHFVSLCGCAPAESLLCVEGIFYPIFYTSYVWLGKSNSCGIVSFIKKYQPIVSNGSQQNMENYELEH
jgi:hypothetical protein